MPREKNPRRLRIARHARVRKQIVGTPDRPRLSVFRSLQHICAQVIDDSRGHTLSSASSLEVPVKELKQGGKTGKAVMVGTLVAKRAKEQGISQVVFDRGGYKYHGRVKALAEAARKGGLTF